MPGPEKLWHGEGLGIGVGFVVGALDGVGVGASLNCTSSNGCSSMPFGATPVCPCRKSKNPTPVTVTGRLAVLKLLVGLNRASNSDRVRSMPGANGLLPPTQPMSAL